MREVNLRLETIDLASQHLPGRLRLSTELSLAVPDSWPGQVTPETISAKVASGHIWVERASPCRVHLDASVAGDVAAESLADGPLCERRLIDIIRSCPTWEFLGLQLVRCSKPDDEHGQPALGAQFYVTHTAAAGPGHVAGRYVPRVEFRQLKCSFDLDFTESLSDFGRKKSLRTAEPTASILATRVPRSKTPRRKVKGRGNVAYSAEQPVKGDVRGAALRALVGASLCTLFGTKKANYGVQSLRPFYSPCLLDIAPGVWNTRYLQEIVLRAPFLPSINSALARLAHTAQSGSLREKIALLGAQTCSTESLNFADRIGGKTWPVLQSGPSTKKTGSRRLTSGQASTVLVDKIVDPNDQNTPERGNHEKTDAEDEVAGIQELRSIEGTVNGSSDVRHIAAKTQIKSEPDENSLLSCGSAWVDDQPTRRTYTQEWNASQQEFQEYLAQGSRDELLGQDLTREWLFGGEPKDEYWNYYDDTDHHVSGCLDDERREVHWGDHDESSAHQCDIQEEGYSLMDEEDMQYNEDIYEPIYGPDGLIGHEHESDCEYVYTESWETQEDQRMWLESNDLYEGRHEIFEEDIYDSRNEDSYPHNDEGGFWSEIPFVVNPAEPRIIDYALGLL